MEVRNALYHRGLWQAEHLEVPVISVGNIVAGGTGKTPMVELLCRRLGERGIPTAVLTRGYGSAGPDGRPDEAIVLARNLDGIPIICGPDRSRSGRRAIERHGARCLVLDDGFQHRRLARDLDLVLIDARNPFGYGHLLPRGLLREPIEELDRADVACITRVEGVAEDRLRTLSDALGRLTGGAPVVRAVLRPVSIERADTGERYPPEWARGRSAVAFSGLGNPGAFPVTLERLGVELLGHRAFPDHHAYGPDDIAALDEAAREAGADVVATTLKDAVKIEDWPTDRPWIVVHVQLELVDGQPLDGRIDELFDREAVT